MDLDGHVAVIDLGYGEAGHDSVVDALCAARATAAVIRFNGAAPAGHAVTTTDGRRHAFGQFGAGTLRGVPTHVSRFTTVDPLAFADEAADLAGLGVPDPFALLTVDAEALLTTPWHRAAERIRGGAAHGPGGQSETIRYARSNPDAPRAADVCHPLLLRRRLAALRHRLTEEFGPLDGPPLDHVADAFGAFGDAVTVVDGVPFLRWLLGSGACVFAGAHGVLMDEWFGWHPHTTPSSTTFANAVGLCGHADLARLGVVATFTARRGAGPLVTADPTLRVPGLDDGRLRLGHFDAVAHRYAVEVVGGVDALVVTHGDAPDRVPILRICTAYEVAGETVPRLAPGELGDLAHQSVLSRLVERARPAALHRPVAAVPAIAGLLGAPLLPLSRLMAMREQAA